MRRAILLLQTTVWQRLPKFDQARLTMALLAFIALLIGVIALVLLMGRFAKREIRKPLPLVKSPPRGTAQKPLPPESKPTSHEPP